MKKYRFIKNETIDNLTKKEILAKLDAKFCGSFKDVAEIEETHPRLYIIKKNGRTIVYKACFGTYGMPTIIY